MRKFRSLISIALVASMALSLAGCAGGGAFSPAALAKYAKGYGAELYTDYEDWQDDLNGGEMPKGISDGIYVNVKGDDVKEAVKKVDMCTEFYDKAIKEATVYIVGKEKSDHEFAAIFMSATYDSKDSALDAYEELAGDLEDEDSEDYDKHDFDDFEENGVQYSLLMLEDEYWEEYTYAGVYYKGNTVFVAFGYGENKKDVLGALDETCEAVGLVSPSEL